GLDTEVRRRQVDRLLQMRSRDATTTVALAEINPIIRTPLWSVDPALQRTVLKPGEQLLFDFRLPIAIAIGEVPNIRRRGGVHAPAATAPSIARRDVVCTNNGLIHSAVAVRIDEHLDGTLRPSLRFLDRLLVRLNTAHLVIELARLIEFLDVVLSLQVVA